MSVNVVVIGLLSFVLLLTLKMDVNAFSYVFLYCALHVSRLCFFVTFVSLSGFDGRSIARASALSPSRFTVQWLYLIEDAHSRSHVI
jgi:hypothetical protein